MTEESLLFLGHLTPSLSRIASLSRTAASDHFFVSGRMNCWARHTCCPPRQVLPGRTRGNRPLTASIQMGALRLSRVSLIGLEENLRSPGISLPVDVSRAESNGMNRSGESNVRILSAE